MFSDKHPLCVCGGSVQSQSSWSRWTHLYKIEAGQQTDAVFGQDSLPSRRHHGGQASGGPNRRKRKKKRRFLLQGSGSLHKIPPRLPSPWWEEAALCACPPASCQLESGGEPAHAHWGAAMPAPLWACWPWREEIRLKSVSLAARQGWVLVLLSSDTVWLPLLINYLTDFIETWRNNCIDTKNWWDEMT